MKRIILISVIISLYLSSSIFASERQYAIYESATGNKITLQQLAQKTLAKQVIFFGEFHDDSIIHSLQKEYLEEMYKLNKKTAVSLEMFERDVQTVMDDYLNAKITEEEMVKNSRPWPDYNIFYKPLVELAKQYKAPVIASNIPRKYANLYSTGGWSAIQQLPANERIFIAKNLQIKEDKYQKSFYNTMLQNMGMDTNAKVTSNQENTLYLYYGAQVIKDETMGESIVDFLKTNKDFKVIHFNGNFHSTAYLGTVQKVNDRNKSLKISVISPIYVDAGAQPNYEKDFKGEGDFIIVLENKPREMGSGTGMMGGALGENYISSHKIKINLDTKKHYLKGSDIVKFNNPILKSSSFRLLKDLKITSITSPNNQIKYNVVPDSMYQEVVISPKSGEVSEIQISYEGKIYHSPDVVLLNQKHSNTPGIISDSTGEGIYLPGGSYFPQSEKDLADFDVEITLPKELTIITSGTLISKNEIGNSAVFTYKSELPTDDMILVGGKYISKDTTYDGKTFSVYTFAPNANAKTFLNASIEYYKYYTELFGPYPYSAFKIVENFFASGFGMPGYTLLSNKLIALPWVVLAPGSLAHEFVHNWWGNSNYVNYDAGNWCEALTTFSTNYYYNVLAKKPDAALDWRKKALLSIEALPENENYPLGKFVSQKNTNDAVIGYQKGGFLFYELLKTVGEEKFFTLVKNFSKKYKGKRASWMTLRMNFSMQSRMLGIKEPLMDIFSQWLDETAIPKIQLNNVKIDKDSVRFEINQDLKYYMHIPVKFETASGIKWQNFIIKDSINKFAYKVDADIIKISVDPEYQCLRKLNKWEIPYSFSLTLGDNPLLILPSKSSTDYKSATEFAQLMKESNYTQDFKSIDDVSETDWINRSIIVLGDISTNNFYNQMINKYPTDINIIGKEIQVKEQKFSTDGNLMLLNCANPKNPDKYCSIIYTSGFNNAEQLRRIFHYQGYSMVLLNQSKPGRPLSQLEIFPTLMNKEALEYNVVK